MHVGVYVIMKLSARPCTCVCACERARDGIKSKRQVVFVCVFGIRGVCAYVCAYVCVRMRVCARVFVMT